jgi:hypothetical protein
VKQLDIFLVIEFFLEKGLIFISKVEEGGISYHSRISLRWIPSLVPPPPTSLKINKVWFDDPDFQNLVSSTSKKLQFDRNEPLMIQFEKNMKNTKEYIKKNGKPKIKRRSLRSKMIFPYLAPDWIGNPLARIY